MIGRAVTGGGDRSGGGHDGHRAVEPAQLDPLERRRAADPDHQARGRGEAEQVRAEQILTRRQLVERELAPLVGDGAGQGDAERRHHRAAKRAAGFVHDRAADRAGHGAGLQPLGPHLPRRRTEHGHAGALRSRRDRCRARPPRRRRTPPKPQWSGVPWQLPPLKYTVCRACRRAPRVRRPPHDRTVNATWRSSDRFETWSVTRIEEAVVPFRKSRRAGRPVPPSPAAPTPDRMAAPESQD